MISDTSSKVFLFIGLSCLTLLLLWAGPSWAQSLLEYYNTTDKEVLAEETEQMTQKLKRVFDPQDIAHKQAQLDFSDFFSNFRNLILYASRLASYYDYQENIRFGRLREIVQVLPPEGMLESERRFFINEKYDRLDQISQEEMETYKDMIETSFDVCELYTEKVFFGDTIFKNREFKKAMEEYFAGKDFRDYKQKKEPLLRSMLPEYAERIDRLVRLWKEPSPSPETPIIDPAVVNAL